MSQINVDIVAPQSGDVVDVNGVEVRTPITGNTLIGAGAGENIVAGPNPWDSINNTAIGENALQSETIGKSNTGIGKDALKNDEGNYNTAVGADSFSLMTGASFGNCGFGWGSFGSVNIAVNNNTGIGTGSGGQFLSGDFNTCLGSNSGEQFDGGSENTTVGARTSSGGTLNSGNQNIFIGTNSCWNFGGGNGNVYLGAYDLVAPYTNSQSGSNNIVIGKNATKATASASNSITLGNSSHTVIRAAVTTITSLSDSRDKKDITDLSAGLDFVKGLKPVEFVWDDRDEDGKHDIKDFGFIAQDLKKAQEDINLADTLKLVYEENPEKLEASYGKLVPILVKAIQELTAKVEALEAK